MTRIDFYILSDADPMARYRVACRIAEKAWGTGHRVHIHTDSPQESRKMDQLLWTFRDRSFVPHAVEPENAGEFPVTIGHSPAPDTRQVLINLAAEVPVFFEQFERVAEIVARNRESSDKDRERYRFYRDRDCKLNHHHLDS